MGRRLPLKKALGALWALDKKGEQLESPTAWILGSVAKAGVMPQMDPQTDAKVKKTIRWYNKYGGLNAKLSYRMVSAPFAKLKPRLAMKILSELGHKGHV